MNIRTSIDEGLQYLTNWRTQMKPKNVSRQRKTSAGTSAPVCGACGGEIAEVNKSTNRRACFQCGKEAK